MMERVNLLRSCSGDLAGQAQLAHLALQLADADQILEPVRGEIAALEDTLRPGCTLDKKLVRTVDMRVGKCGSRTRMWPRRFTPAADHIWTE